MALSVLPAGLRRFKGVSFLLGRTSRDGFEIVRGINLQNTVVKQRSFVVFGQSFQYQKPLIIGSQESSPRFAEIEGGLTEDVISRSSTPVNDINGDGFDDLIICYPGSSLCLIYLGAGNGFQNMIVSFSISSLVGDEFGWSVTGVNDWNKDGFNDFVICGKGGVGFCSLIFGRPNFPSRMTVDPIAGGFQIIGSPSYFNLGISVANGNDFNGDGLQDLVISAIDSLSRGIVFVLLGPLSASRSDNQIISLDAPAFSSSILKIVCPRNSFTGFSLAGIGDLNNDGFDDIAIGSLPFRGGYLTQRTYVVFGSAGSPSTNGSIFLDLNEMVMGKDGFVIIGAGFQVNAIGDVNNDGIADLVVSSYSDWFGKINSYLSVFPTNVSAPPTYFPSSSPSSYPTSNPTALPTYRSTSFPSSSPTPSYNGTSWAPVTMNTLTSRPSRVPVVRKTAAPTPVLLTSVPSRIPTALPTLLPTVISSRPPIPNSVSPSILPSRARRTSNPTILKATPPPTSNQTSEINKDPFTVITLSEPGEFAAGSLAGNVEFAFTAPGSYYIDSRPSVQASPEDQSSQVNVKVYSLIPMENEIKVTFFDPFADVIDLTKFPTILSLDDLSCSSSPLKIVFPVPSERSVNVNQQSVRASNFDTVKMASSTSSASKWQSITLLNVDDLQSLSSQNFMFATPSRSKNNIIETQALISFGLIVAGCSFAVLLTAADCKDEREDSDMKERYESEDSDDEEEDDDAPVQISLPSSNNRDDTSRSPSVDEDDQSHDDAYPDEIIGSHVAEDNCKRNSSHSSKSGRFQEDEQNQNDNDSQHSSFWDDVEKDVSHF
jgi:hypothetical protein